MEEQYEKELKSHGDRLDRVEKDVQEIREDLRSGLQSVNEYTARI
jgi:hypothetical protein